MKGLYQYQASNEESYESSISEYQTREFLELVQRTHPTLTIVIKRICVICQVITGGISGGQKC